MITLLQILGLTRRMLLCFFAFEVHQHLLLLFCKFWSLLVHLKTSFSSCCCLRSSGAFSRCCRFTLRLLLLLLLSIEVESDKAAASKENKRSNRTITQTTIKHSNIQHTTSYKIRFTCDCHVSCVFASARCKQRS